jgi:cytochrome c biogenesis protein CcdA
MRIATSLVIIALGAILRFAITREVNGVDIQAIGVILMALGAAALLITFILMSTRRRTDVIRHRDGSTTLVEPGAGYMTPVTYTQPVTPVEPATYVERRIIN